ncbi:signal peptidase I [Methylocaldum sp. RMAD-M]|jgi:conjugal transfer pilin signal peptidase TrbI|uniref:signal peptidase I n=1 Tax=Methylocaldum sp. RMAD-M TaxID=2806557 RepID=UPI0012EB975B|nr:signal peptidase I [Methylocaldum sp. RMAD-M]MBP1151282.1 conjugal transfer pilin signal peptidase TrbI [Methylocaldum sp. RMAD-M]MVF24164.1 signal peptidase I [Methylocaldum sp. BRCS4]
MFDHRTDALPLHTAPARRRVPLRAFLGRALPLLALILAAEYYLGHRFRLGIDAQKDTCLDGARIVLIDTYDQNIWRGDLVAFRAERMAPYFEDGRTIVKLVAGVSGDRVRVDEVRTTVNGAEIARGLPLSDKLKKAPAAFRREETVPPGAYWVTGTTPKSFDSRYWGHVYDRQIIGRVYALF